MLQEFSLSAFICYMLNNIKYCIPQIRLPACIFTHNQTIPDNPVFCGGTGDVGGDGDPGFGKMG